MAPGSTGGSGSAQYYLLDMGTERYGDCLLCRLPGSVNILIDGGNTSDCRSVKEQLKDILGPPPFPISLLVLTHCHSDHLGCLPDLLQHMDVRWALLADPEVRFGPPSRDLVLTPEEEAAARVFAALSEEGAGEHPEAETRDFLDRAFDAARGYRQLADDLRERIGDHLVLFRGTGGTEGLDVLEEHFAGVGLKVLGPTKDQVAVCEQILGEVKREVEDAVRGARGLDEAELAETLYRQLTEADATGTREVAARGSRDPRGCVNDTSIVLAMSASPTKALFLGDMQLADPQVGGVVPHVAQLRQTIQEHGGYQFVKLAHHTSDNGLSDDILRSWLGEEREAKLLCGHSGGKDPNDHHPDRNARTHLRAHRAKLQFARTDHNGRVEALGKGGKLAFAEPERGRLNDFGDPG